MTGKITKSAHSTNSVMISVATSTMSTSSIVGPLPRIQRSNQTTKWSRSQT